MLSTITDAATEATAVLLRELAPLGAEPADAAALAPTPAALDWADSGAMHLTGPLGTPPRLAPGAPASWMRAAARFVGTPLTDPAALLGERAACAGFGRPAPTPMPGAVGGAYRSLRTRDGWVGLSLPRRADLELVPALVGGPVACDPWATLATWAAARDGWEIEQRLRLLGLAGGRIPDGAGPSYRPAVRLRRGGTRGRGPAPLVVDLSALWAGPLCASLLGRCGARVIKIESVDRPDGARRGPRTFFDLLHGGAESVALDFGSGAGRSALGELVRRADVVVESSRPRALQQLGVFAEEHVAAGAVWVSITGYGRDEPQRVGFGDDIAAVAGLVDDDGCGPYPVGDAIADPLTGMTAAAAAASALRTSRGWLVDVSMRDVATAAARLPAEAATVEPDGPGWRVSSAGRTAPVRPPRARVATHPAPELGAHTDYVLGEFVRRFGGTGRPPRRTPR